MTDQTPAVITTQPDLFDDVARLRSMADADFRVLCSDYLGSVRIPLKKLRGEVGIMLAEAHRRWDEATYVAFEKNVVEIIGVDRQNLWRWRRRGEAALGGRAAPVESRSRSRRPAIDPIPTPSISQSTDPTTSVPPPDADVNQVSDSGVEPEGVGMPSGSAAQQIAGAATEPPRAPGSQVEEDQHHEESEAGPSADAQAATRLSSSKVGEAAPARWVGKSASPTPRISASSLVPGPASSGTNTEAASAVTGLAEKDPDEGAVPPAASSSAPSALPPTPTPKAPALAPTPGLGPASGASAPSGGVTTTREDVAGSAARTTTPPVPSHAHDAHLKTAPEVRIVLPDFPTADDMQVVVNWLTARGRQYLLKLLPRTLRDLHAEVVAAWVTVRPAVETAAANGSANREATYMPKASWKGGK